MLFFKLKLGSDIETFFGNIVDNLKKVIQALNGDQGAVRTEIALNIAVMKEIRAEMSMPMPEVHEKDVAAPTPEERGHLRHSGSTHLTHQPRRKDFGRFALGPVHQAIAQ